MKKALAGVLVASLVGLAAVGATAQVPYIQIYFDGNPQYKAFSETQSNCVAPDGESRDVYVVMNNWNMFVAAVEFSVDYPPALYFLGETPPANTLVIGSSPSLTVNGPGTGGVAIAWNLPQDGYAPLLAMTVHVLWTSNCDCSAPPQALVVRGYNYANAGNGGNADPVAVRWPDYVELSGVGMTSLICPGVVSTEQTTWGGVKALYR